MSDEEDEEIDENEEDEDEDGDGDDDEEEDEEDDDDEEEEGGDDGDDASEEDIDPDLDVRDVRDLVVHRVDNDDGSVDVFLLLPPIRKYANEALRDATTQTAVAEPIATQTPAEPAGSADAGAQASQQLQPVMTQPPPPQQQQQQHVNAMQRHVNWDAVEPDELSDGVMAPSTHRFASSASPLPPARMLPPPAAQPPAGYGRGSLPEQQQQQRQQQQQHVRYQPQALPPPQDTNVYFVPRDFYRPPAAPGGGNVAPPPAQPSWNVRGSVDSLEANPYHAPRPAGAANALYDGLARAAPPVAVDPTQPISAQVARLLLDHK